MIKQIKYFTFILTYFVCIQITYTQPINDNYTSPVILSNLSNWCSANSEYSNVDATADFLGSPSCWSSLANNDVWFSFTAIATAVNISIYGIGTGGGTLSYPRVSLCTITSGIINYMGNACSEASSANPGYTNLYLSNLVIGNTYYIRVDGVNANTGTFRFCINNFTPPVNPGQDCNTNSFLCNKKSITQASLNGSGAYPDEGKGTCMDVSAYGQNSENNSAWYTFKIAQSGILTFTIDPDNNEDDIDFALFILPDGTCQNRQLVRCSASHCFISQNVIGPTGLNMTSTDTWEGPGCISGQDNWVKYVNVNAGETYALLINNWSENNVGQGNGFTLSFGGSSDFAGPIADFDYSIISSCLENNSIIYTDKSTSAESYHWDFGDSAMPQSADSQGPYTVSYTTAGSKTIVLSVTGKGGCQVIKTVNINIKSDSIFTLNDTSVCKGQSIKIFADGFNTYKWSNGSVTNPLIVTPDVTTTYYLTATNSSGCLSKGSVLVMIKTITLTAASNSPICEGDTLRLFASSINNATYKWNGPLNFSSNSEDPIILNVDYKYNGNYSVFADIDGCITPEEGTIVKINKRPSNFLPADTNTCGAFNFRINIKNPYKNLLWQDGSNLTYYDIADTGKYWLNVTDENNCTGTDTMIVREFCPPVLWIPTAFTPNKDNINDNFLVQGEYITKYNIKIFDRWGSMVYESNDIKAPWDGTLNGRPLQFGVYVVLIHYESIQNKKPIKKEKITQLTILR